MVIENGPRGGLAEVVQQFPRDLQFTYLYSEPPNKSLALNVALARVGAALCVFTDDDVQVPAGTLGAYARAAAHCTGGEFYGGPILPDYEGEPPPEWLRRYLPRSAAGWQLAATQQQEIRQAEFIGPNFAAFAGDVRRVGGFDPRLGPGQHMISPGEDTEIQERLLARGIRGFYVPDAPMRHLVRATATSLEFAVHRAERNGVYWGIQQARQAAFFPAQWVKLCGQWLNDRWRIAKWRRVGGEATCARAAFVESRWKGRWQGIRIGWRST